MPKVFKNFKKGNNNITKSCHQFDSINVAPTKSGHEMEVFTLINVISMREILTQRNICYSNKERNPDQASISTLATPACRPLFIPISFITISWQWHFIASKINGSWLIKIQ